MSVPRLHASAKGPGWYCFTIGAVGAVVLTDGPLGKAQSREEFPTADPATMEELLRAHGLPPEYLLFEQNCLVIETDEGLALFDTGLGQSDVFGTDAGRLMDTLSAAGIDAAHIAAVFLTHAHPDHCFGIAGPNGRPSFPNANIYLSAEEYAFWTSSETAAHSEAYAGFVAGTRKAFAGYGNRTILINPGDEPVRGIRALAAPGHTVGHLIYEIGSGPDRCVVLGDAAYHFALSFAHPEWHSSFDSDPVVAAVTRHRLLSELADTGARVVGYHFPFPGLGHVERDGTAFRYVPELVDLSPFPY